jgi:hypothetical protein
MSLEKIKQKILETKAIAERTIDENSKEKSGLESAKNQAIQKLEELKGLYREEIKKNTTLHLVYAPNLMFNVGTPANVFVLNHKDLAAKLSTGVVNAIRPNHGLTAYHTTPLNEMLREICKDIGLNVEHLPDMAMQNQFTHAIQGREHLVDTIEAMLEYYMKSNEEEVEGHAIQAVYTANNYLNFVEASPVSSDLHLFVFATSLSRDIKASYGRFLTNNIKSISFDNKKQAEKYFNTGEELQEYVNNLGVVEAPKPVVVKPVPTKLIKMKKEKVQKTDELINGKKLGE